MSKSRIFVELKKIYIGLHAQSFLNRAYIIDIWKFLASIIIMCHHIFIIGVRGDYPFSDGAIFVELFLYITGYYTVQHCFMDANDNNYSESQKALVYTLKKFSMLLPFTVPATIATYIIHNYTVIFSDGIKPFLARLTDMPTELIFLGSSYGINENAPIWYLSCLFLCFPLFYLVIQKFDSYTVVIIALILGAYRYGISDIVDRGYYLDFCRIFAGVLIGAAIYIFKSKVERVENCRCKSIIAHVLMIFAIGINAIGLYMPRVFVFIFILSVAFGSSVYTNNRIIIKMSSFLSKVSIPIYTWHWGIGAIVSNMNIASNVQRIIVYYLLTIIIAIINVSIVTIVNNHRHSSK